MAYQKVSGLVSKLNVLASEAASCQRCALSLTRKKSVFGDGDPLADLVAVGEGPGDVENMIGLPFVGRAGKLLDRILETIGRDRTNTRILNAVCCRACDEPAPGSWKAKHGELQDRPPVTSELEECSRFFIPHIELLPHKKLILCFGSTATHWTLGLELGSKRMGSFRGRFFGSRFGVPVTATYHPSYLLRRGNEEEKTKVYEDVLKAKAFLDGKLKPEIIRVADMDDRSSPFRKKSDDRKWGKVRPEQRDRYTTKVEIL